MLLNKPVNSPITTVLPLKNTITELAGTSLIGYWPLLDRGYDAIRDYSGRNNHLTRTGATYNAGLKGNVIYLDGVDDLLTQQVFAGKVGTVTASMTENEAFINDSGQNFAPYACTSFSLKSYMLIATDSTGKKAWGYVGEQSGFSETGIKIYATQTGLTQSWADVESGFDANAISSYEVRKTDFQIMEALTVGAWVKPHGASEAGYIVSKFNNAIAGWSLFWSGDTDRLVFYYDGTSHSKSSNAIFTDDDQWVFVTVTKDGSGNLVFYRNGIAAGTSSGATVSDSSNDFRIGTRTGGTMTIQFFNGSIANPFICNRVLSASEILAIYNDPSCRP